jgi:predicted dehydrogenase
MSTGGHAFLPSDPEPSWAPVPGILGAAQQPSLPRSDQPDVTLRVVPRPLRVGVIGMGRVGRRRAKCVQTNNELELVAVCDVDPNRKGEWPELQFATDYRELARGDLDALIVSAYNRDAPQIAISAIREGKHVFCEKPPGRCVEDVEAMISALKSQPQVKLKFGFNHRYHHSVMEARQMIQSGRFGRVMWLRGVYGKCGSTEFTSEWRNDPAISGGGILLDQGIHMLDLFRFLGGEFTEVKSVVTNAYWKTPVEDNAFAILTNDQGQVATIHSSATHWKHRFSLDVCLEDGYINLLGILSSTRSYGDETLTFARKQFEDTTRAVGRPREEMICFDTDESWQLEIDDFVDAIRRDRPVTSGNVDDALQVMKTIRCIYSGGGTI